MMTTPPINEAKEAKREDQPETVAPSPKGIDKTVQEKSQEALVKKEPKHYAEATSHLQELIVHGKVTYLDALEYQAMHAHNCAVLAELEKKNQGKDKGKQNIKPLSFAKEGCFESDPSWKTTRAIHDYVFGLFETLTGGRICSSYDNDRYNILRWAKFTHYFYDVQCLGPIETNFAIECLTTNILGLDYLDTYYETKDAEGDPKRGIVKEAKEILAKTLDILNEKRMHAPTFPSLIKANLTHLGGKDEMKGIAVLSYELQFLLDEFVINGPFHFLYEFCRHLKAGGSSDHLALALACVLWVERESLIKDPEKTLQTLQAKMKLDSPDYANFYDQVSRKWQLVSPLMDVKRAASAVEKKNNANKMLLAVLGTTVAAVAILGVTKEVVAVGALGAVLTKVGEGLGSLKDRLSGSSSEKKAETTAP